MSVEEDIKNKQNQSTQAETAAANKAKLDAIRKRNEDLAKRQKEAKKALESKKAFYDVYITQLSTGTSKGKKLSPVKLQQIREAAENLNKEMAELRKLIAQKPEVVRLPTAPKPQATKTTTGPTGSVTLQATKTAKETAAKEAKTPPPAKDKGKATPDKDTGTTLTPSGNAIPGTFDPAVVRAGEEASMGATPNIPPKSQRDLESILRQTEFWYDLPDYIFKTVPKLGELLVKAVKEWLNDGVISINGSVKNETGRGKPSIEYVVV